MLHTYYIKQTSEDKNWSCCSRNIWWRKSEELTVSNWRTFLPPELNQLNSVNTHRSEDVSGH